MLSTEYFAPSFMDWHIECSTSLGYIPFMCKQLLVDGWLIDWKRYPYHRQRSGWWTDGAVHNTASIAAACLAVAWRSGS
jgi:hypothetical protein